MHEGGWCLRERGRQDRGGGMIMGFIGCGGWRLQRETFDPSNTERQDFHSLAHF